MLRYKRSVRVGDLMREEIADILMHKIKDPRIGFVTVTGVDLSDDLRHAKVFLSIYKDEEKETTLKAIEVAKGFIRRELGKRISLRFLPELMFRLDKSIEYGNKIDRILKEISNSKRLEETEKVDDP
ncbi:MAG: 30S ribosome-binding factor RbfA [Nitrospirae bacterium]|nr:30S ribosome-binding factor RbfA [Nitrospirota bacterium]